MKTSVRGADERTSDVRQIRPWLRHLVHGSLWVLIGIAAIGGVTGLVRMPKPVAHPGGRADESVNVPSPVLGFAELAVRSWLIASPDSVTLLAPLFVIRPEPAVASTAPLNVGDVTTVAASLVENQYWAVTVAARVGSPAGEQPSTLWFFEVGVMEDTEGALGVVGAPALIPAPRAVADKRQPLVSVLRRPDPQDPVAMTVEGFLAALLAGGGDVTRYLAPDATIVAVSPPPFRAVEVSAVASTRTPRNEVLVRAEIHGITPSDDTWMLSYELVLVERGDRLEVRKVSGAPALAPATSGSGSAATPTSLKVATTTTWHDLTPGA